MDIICMGEMLIDFTPGKEKRSYICNPGGAPANVCIASARSGVSSAFLGVLGNDDFGRFLKNTLEENKVQILIPTLTDKAVTTLAFVALYENGERSFTFVRKPGADILLSTDDIKEEDIKKTKILNCGSFGMSAEPSREAHFYAMKFAKENNKLVSFDINYRSALWSYEEAKSTVDKVFPYVDLLKISGEELDFVGGEENIQNLMKEYKISAVIETLGKRGARYFYNGHSGTVDGYMVNAVDVTGAGDAFWGTFLSKLILSGVKNTSDLNQNLIRDAVIYGNGAGALCVQKYGGIPSLPSKNEIKKFVSQKN